jgi:TP901 family phage tail tape measure protein
MAEYVTTYKHDLRQWRKGKAEMLRDSQIITESILGIGKAVKKSGGKIRVNVDEGTKSIKNQTLALGGLLAAYLSLDKGIDVIANSTDVLRQFEKGLISVSKTAGLDTPESIDEMSDSILRMADVLPASTSQLFKIAKASAQVGVQGTDNILQFTETLVRLESATDIKGEELALILQRLLNIAGEGSEEVDNLANALAVLGDTTAATEAEIADNATRVSRAGALYFKSSAEALGFAAATREVGMQSEIAGSVVGRTFQQIRKAVQEGGSALQVLKEVAGENIAEVFDEDATAGLLMFLEGLGKLEKTEVVPVMDQLGLVGIRLRDNIPLLAKNFEQVNATVQRSVQAFTNTNKLMSESEKAFGTLDSRINLFTNRLERSKLVLAEAFLPALLDALEGVEKLVDENQEAIASFGAFAGTALKIVIEGMALAVEHADALAVSLGSLVAAMLLVKASAFTTSIAALSVAVPVLTAQVTALWVAIAAHPFLLAAAAAGILANELTKLKIKQLEKDISNLVDPSRKASAELDKTAKAVESTSTEVKEARLAELADQMKDVERRSKLVANEVELLGSNYRQTAIWQEELSVETANLKAEENLLRRQQDELTKSLNDLTEKTEAQTKAEQDQAEAEEKAAKNAAERAEAERRKAQAIENATKKIKDLKQANKLIGDFGISIEESTEIVRLMGEGVPLEQAAQMVFEAQKLKAELEEAGKKSEYRENAAEAALELERAKNEAIELNKELDEAETKKIVDKLEADFRLKFVADVDTDLEFDAPSGDKLDDLTDAYKDQLTAVDKLQIGLKNSEEGIWMLFDALVQTNPQLAGLADGVMNLLSEFMETGKFSKEAFGQMAGDIIGAFGNAMGLVGGGISEFGGQMEGNLLQEGAALGQKLFGPAGAIVLGAVGALVSTGADDFHSDLQEINDRAVLNITQAEGGLEEVAQKIKQQMEGYLNSIQDALDFIDLEFDKGQNEIHIREDRIRVVANGIERVFHEMDEALAFFAQGVLSANATAEGITPNIQALFNSLAGPEVVASLEEIQAGIELAQRLDLAAISFSNDMVNRERELLDLAAKFNLNRQQTIALINQEIQARRDSIAQTSLSIRGAKDYTSAILAITEEMEQFNKESDSLSKSRDERIALIKEELAAREQGTSVMGESTEALQANAEGARGFRDGAFAAGEGFDRVSDSAQEGTEAFDGLEREILKTVDSTADLEAELAALEEAEQVAKFQAEEIQKLWDTAAAEAGQSLITMIQSIAGPTALIAEQEQFRHFTTLTALGAQIEAAKILLATSEAMSDAARAALTTVITEGERVLEGLLTGEIEFPPIEPPKFAAGPSRRDQAEEERQRREEEAAQTLQEFNTELERMEFNASTASGSLGDFIFRLREITAAADEAAAAGASAADVQRSQSLALEREEEQLLDPFRATQRPSTARDLGQVSQQEQDALERARLLAEAQAQVLGKPVEDLFAEMERVIVNGASRARRAIVTDLVQSLGLPREQIRKSTLGTVRTVRSLTKAYGEGELSGRRYADIIDQVTQQQSSSLVNDLLSAVDNLGLSNEKTAEITQRMAEIERLEMIANFRLRIRLLQKEQILTDEALADALELLNILETSSVETLDEVEDAGRRASSSLSEVSSSVSTMTDDLAEAIRQFVQEFNKVGIGPFQSQAQTWIDAITDFERRIREALVAPTPSGSIGQVIGFAAQGLFGIVGTVEEVLAQIQELNETDQQDILDRLRGLSGQTGDTWDQAADAFEAWMEGLDLATVRLQAADKILGEYGKSLQSTNELQQQLDTINIQFMDAVNALNLLNASANQLAEAEAIRQQHLANFIDQAFSGVDALIGRILGGAFGGVSPLDLASEAAESFSDLVRRTLDDANGFDFEALQGLEGAGEDAIQRLIGLTGGEGEEFQRLLAEILADLQEVRSAGIDIEDPETQMQQDQLQSMMNQEALLFDNNVLTEETNERLGVLLDGVNRTNQILGDMRSGEPTQTTRPFET